MLKKGDFISIDGTSGEVFAGEVKTAPSEVVQVLVSKTLDGKDSLAFQQFDALMKMADQLPHAANPHQRGHARPGRQRRRVRRAGRGPDPHRAHVLRGRPHRRHARDDPRRRRGSPPRRAGQAAALPEGRLRRHLPRVERAARDDPLPRPAPARVPAARQGGSRRTSPRSSASTPRRSRNASPNCTSSTRCWAIAAAAWA